MPSNTSSDNLQNPWPCPSHDMLPFPSGFPVLHHQVPILPFEAMHTCNYNLLLPCRMHPDNLLSFLILQRIHPLPGFVRQVICDVFLSCHPGLNSTALLHPHPWKWQPSVHHRLIGTDFPGLPACLALRALPALGKAPRQQISIDNDLCSLCQRRPALFVKAVCVLCIDTGQAQRM